MSEPRLHILVASSPARALDDVISIALADRVPLEDISQLWPGAWLIYTNAAAAAIRDWMRPLLGDDESLFVAPCDEWSSAGPGVDSGWLLRRGH